MAAEPGVYAGEFQEQINKSNQRSGLGHIRYTTQCIPSVAKPKHPRAPPPVYVRAPQLTFELSIAPRHELPIPHRAVSALPFPHAESFICGD